MAWAVSANGWRGTTSARLWGAKLSREFPSRSCKCVPARGVGGGGGGKRPGRDCGESHRTGGGNFRVQRPRASGLCERVRQCIESARQAERTIFSQQFGPSQAQAAGGRRQSKSLPTLRNTSVNFARNTSAADERNNPLSSASTTSDANSRTVPIWRKSSREQPSSSDRASV